MRFPEALRFPGEDGPKATVWFNVNKEGSEGGAEEAAWEYFQEVQKRFARQHGRSLRADLFGDSGLTDGFGPLRERSKDGKLYHGDEENHRFRVVRRPFGSGTNPSSKLTVSC